MINDISDKVIYVDGVNSLGLYETLSTLLYNECDSLLHNIVHISSFNNLHVNVYGLYITIFTVFTVFVLIFLHFV
jgi:hypothetical protein